MQEVDTDKIYFLLHKFIGKAILFTQLGVCDREDHMHVLNISYKELTKNAMINKLDGTVFISLNPLEIKKSFIDIDKDNNINKLKIYYSNSESIELSLIKNN